MEWEKPSPDVAMVYGFWGQNIGNAFFNIGGQWALKEALGQDEIGLIQDQPGYKTFHDQTSGNPARAFNLLQSISPKLLVLQGPMLTTSFRALWEPTFRALAEKGTKILLLGAGLFRYSNEEIDVARSFLKESPVIAMVTRDNDTFECLGGDVPLAYNGIDSAFFAPRAFRPLDLDTDDYVCFGFDRYPEPNMTVGPPAKKAHTAQFDWNGSTWTLDTPGLTQRFSEKGKSVAYLGHLLDRRRLPDRIGGFTIVRPEHRTNPYLAWKVYRHPNGVGSDEPFTYLTLYSQAALTLSDRVHACVGTLAYGNPAMLFTPSPRSRLFERLGLSAIRERPVTLDPDLLRGEQDAELSFLRGLVGELGLSA